MKKWTVYDPVFESDELDHQLKLTPWSTNRRFAYDLVRNIKPRQIVELGSHYGCSLFCFAQAIKDGRLDTSLSGIDMWTGDEQAGFYGEEILEKVKEIKTTRFGDVRLKLIRKRFSDAVSEFEDNSIDLLHIDGLHTYAAVKEDFESWLPKLAPQGIVLFHDITGDAKKKGYGSVLFWAEVAKKYTHTQLMHSWGLGVLFPKGDKHYKLLEESALLNFLQLYEIAAIQELYKNRCTTEKEWHEMQSTRWWEEAMRTQKLLDSVHNLTAQDVSK